MFIPISALLPSEYIDRQIWIVVEDTTMKKDAWRNHHLYCIFKRAPACAMGEVQDRFLRPGKDCNFSASGLPFGKHIFQQTWGAVDNTTRTKDAWNNCHLPHSTRELDRRVFCTAKVTIWNFTTGFSFYYSHHEPVVPTNQCIILNIKNQHHLILTFYTIFRDFQNSQTIPGFFPVMNIHT